MPVTSATQRGLTQALGLMDTVQEHSHNFLPGAWPFSDAVNTAAFTSAQVLDGAPVLLVFHDHDGEWQFLHGPVTEHDECRLICLGCVFDRDNSVGILGDLQPGWMASRDALNKSFGDNSARFDG